MIAAYLLLAQEPLKAGEYVEWAFTPSKVELVRAASQGGMMPRGRGETHLTIALDGSIIFQQGDTRKQSRLTPMEVSKLRRWIDAADYAAMRKVPYTRGYLNAAIDGSDTAYGFRTRKGIETWANYRYTMESNPTLFMQIGDLLRSKGIETWLFPATPTPDSTPKPAANPSPNGKTI